MTLPPPEHTAMLAQLFRKAEGAGWGIADGASFEAYPGLEDAAADYIQSLVDKMGVDDIQDVLYLGPGQ